MRIIITPAKKMAVDGCRDLYQFWGDRLARQLASETDVVLNLASRECQRRCDFVIFRRTGNVRKWRIKVCSL